MTLVLVVVVNVLIVAVMVVVIIVPAAVVVAIVLVELREVPSPDHALLFLVCFTVKEDVPVVLVPPIVTRSVVRVLAP